MASLRLISLAAHAARLVVVGSFAAQAVAAEPDVFDRSASDREQAASEFEKRLEALQAEIKNRPKPEPPSFGENVDVRPDVRGYKIMHVLEADGTPVRPLVDDFSVRHRYDHQGSPAWSPDGSKVAFDCWSVSRGESFFDTQVVVLDADGSDARVVCDGCLPSFSPDGSRLAVSRTGRERGVWVMNADGTDRELIDRNAWSIQFSPDGKSLLYYGGRNGSWNTFSVHDLETERVRELFSGSESPFNRVGWNFDWAPDGRRFAFWAKTREGDRAVVSVLEIDGGLDSLVTVRDAAWGRPARMHVAWHADGERLLLDMPSATDGRRMTHVVEAEERGADRPLAAVPEGLVAGQAVSSPDGERLVAALLAR